jgi:signal transduction histidine kinase
MQHAPRESQPMYKPVLWGIFTTFVLIIAFNLILPAFFNNSQFIRYSALFIFPTVVSAAYAIRIRHLFNVKVFSTALLVFLLAIVSFGEIIFSGTFSLILFHSGVFILVLVFGINLIRSVLREVEQREKLEVANRGQENLIHIMNHQIKGYLGTARSIFAELVGSNDYGQMPEASKPLLAKGLEEMGEGVDYVQAILKGASAQSGALPYDMKPVDLKSLISNLAAEQKEVAEKAGLSFESNIADGDYAITGDATMLEEAFKNLITNAIKYNNPNGSIAVTLSRTDGKILFSVKDSGKGISKDDEPRLFKPGGVGKDSTHYNVEASGFGLAFVKPVIEKHQGRVWFKSNSPDKGTTFFVELPFTS